MSKLQRAERVQLLLPTMEEAMSGRAARGRKRRVEQWQLDQRRGLPLHAKIQLSQNRIRAWLAHWRGRAYVAYSGGLDSTALLHLVRSVNSRIPAVFFDTGLEFPEIRAHVQATERVIWRRPAMMYRAVIDRYGFPMISKRVAQYLHEVRVNRERHPGEMTPIQRLRLTGVNSRGQRTRMSKIPEKWQFLLSAPFHISHRCCDAIKRRPARLVEKELGPPLLGTRAAEGQQRELAYLRYGCNAFTLRRPRSTPIAFWTDADVTRYIAEHELRYAAVYDMGYARTGCVFCGFGCHLNSPNRFERLRDTHPRLWAHCMDTLGMREVLRYCGIPTGDRRAET